MQPFRNIRRRQTGRYLELDSTRQSIGELHTRLVAQCQILTLHEAEFSVFSQWGEDGIIQYLVRQLPVIEGSFVEIGVGDYAESNTRFLLVKNNWRGLIVDAGVSHIQFVTESGLRWRHHIEPISIFITRENVNHVLSEAGFNGGIDLLSLDIDGNDYWILDALEGVRPKIIVAEYNSLFGSERRVSIPYDPSFRRQTAHYSSLYYGASLGAIAGLMDDRDYALIGANSAGNNAFFLRREFVTDLPEQRVDEAFVGRRFREARDKEGNLMYTSSDVAQLQLIASMPLLDLDTGREASIHELYGLE